MTLQVSDPKTHALIITGQYGQKGTNMDLNDTIKTFVLNIPAIIDLRNDVASLKDAPAPDSSISEADWDAIADSARDAARDYFESEVDMADAVENAITYGYVDLSSALDYDEIVSNSSEFGDLQTQVQDNKDNIEELTSALDNLSDAVLPDANGSEEDRMRIARLEALVAELESRLDNAEIRI